MTLLSFDAGGRPMVAFFAALLTAGCASPLERPQVAQRFQDTHHCPGADIHADGDRWIAEGCGVRARYVCVNKYTNDVLLTGDTCIEEGSDSIEESAPNEELPSEAPTERGGSLISAVRLPNGWFVA